MSNILKNALLDSSTWALLASNLIMAYFAITEGWNLTTIMLIYWCQSVIIGFFNFIRILQLKEFSTKGLSIWGKQPAPMQATKTVAAFFFLFHYGFFHIVYLMFILIEPLFFGLSLELAKSSFIVIGSAAVFFVNHLFSYIHNRNRDTKKLSLRALMSYPYIRIIPMHLTIIFGFAMQSGLVLFLALKTLADVAMHIAEHEVLRKSK